MSVKQISVLVENCPGAICEITGVLAESGVNLLTLTMADTKYYGIIRLVADNAQKAERVLKEAGHTVSVRDMCGFTVPDKEGELNKALGFLRDRNINIEYMYALTNSDEGEANFVVRVEDAQLAEQVLAQNNITVI